MKASPKQTVTQEISIWTKIQTVCIVIATAWGIWTFVLKEIIHPKSAPLNIIVDLQLKKIGLHHSPKQQAENRALIAVEMTVSVTNPSSRTVYVLPSVWTARGFKVEAYQWEISEFLKNATSDLNPSSEDYGEKHVTTDYAEKFASTDTPLPMFVAAGRLLIDENLKPNEKVTRKIVFHVPSSEFDLVKVVAFIPTIAEKNGATVKWVFDEKFNSFHPQYYRISKNAELIEIKRDEYDDKLNAPLKLQSAINVTALSLW